MMRGSCFKKPMPGGLCQLLLKIGHVGHANHGLLGKTLQLRRKQRRLKLTQPVVEANRPMVKLIGDTGPAGVDVGLYAARDIRGYW